MEELKNYISLLEDYLRDLRNNKEKAEEVVEKYFNVLPPELLGGGFVDRFMEEKEKWYDLLVEALEHRLKVIRKLNEDNKKFLLVQNEFLLRFLEMEV